MSTGSISPDQAMQLAAYREALLRCNDSAHLNGQACKLQHLKRCFVREGNRELLRYCIVCLQTIHRRLVDLGESPNGTTIYAASRLSQKRATKDEVADRRAALFAIVEEMKPMTVRQVFYQATVRGIVEKNDPGYDKVQRDLVEMRVSKLLPFSCLTDSTRWQRKPQTFDSVQQALEDTARFYRKALWTDANAYVEIWLEKDALAGVIYPITSLYDVSLMVTRGYASLSFLHSAAEYIKDLEVPAYIYHLGDFDPSGGTPARRLKKRFGGWRQQHEFTSSGSQSLPNRFPLGICLPDRPSRQIADQRISGRSRSNSTR